MLTTLEIAQDLIALPSITPDDAGSIDYITKFLENLGFECQSLNFQEVKNLWAVYRPTKPLFVFAGHVDVVPPGPLQAWTSPPFEPTLREGYLYGRGAADMKSSLAAMLAATAQFIKKYPDSNAGIAFLITSDEEGKAQHGTRAVVDWLREQKIEPDWCLVGEATCEKHFGDTIKIGRRGSLSFKVIFQGKQGHIAYPQLALNPIHLALPALHQLAATHWDEGDEHFQPTSLQLSNIHAGVGANNVIPATLEVLGNFRYSKQQTAQELKDKTQAIFDEFTKNYTIEWEHSAIPYYSPPGQLSRALSTAIKEICNVKPNRSTTGGTSDGRFLSRLGAEIVEFGPMNQTIHQINECVLVSELEQLEKVYLMLLGQLFLNND